MLVEMECLNVKVLKAPRASLFTKPVKLQFCKYFQNSVFDTLLLKSNTLFEGKLDLLFLTNNIIVKKF